MCGDHHWDFFPPSSQTSVFSLDAVVLHSSVGIFGYSSYREYRPLGGCVVCVCACDDNPLFFYSSNYAMWLLSVVSVHEVTRVCLI